MGIARCEYCMSGESMQEGVRIQPHARRTQGGVYSELSINPRQPVPVDGHRTRNQNGDARNIHVDLGRTHVI